MQVNISSKGQLIFKMSIGFFKSTKKNNEIFVRISELVSKQRSNQRSSVTESKKNHPNSSIKCPYSFDLTSFQKSWKKFRVFWGRFEDTKRTF